MSRTDRERLGILDLMHAVAGFGLLLGGLTSAPESRTVLAIAGVGLGLWSVELLRGTAPDIDDARRGRFVVVVALAAMLALELAGVSVSLQTDDPSALLFFGTAAVFQTAAIVTTLHCGPDDMSLVAWGSLHGSIAFAASLAGLYQLALWLGGVATADLLNQILARNLLNV